MFVFHWKLWPWDKKKHLIFDWFWNRSEPPLPDSRHLVARLARLQHVRQAPVTRHWEWSLEQGAIIIICSSTTAEGHVGITAYHRFGGVRAWDYFILEHKCQNTGRRHRTPSHLPRTGLSTLQKDLSLRHNLSYKSTCEFPSHLLLMKSAARSPIIMVGALVLPDVTAGITLASATRRRSSPCTWKKNKVMILKGLSRNNSHVPRYSWVGSLSFCTTVLVHEHSATFAPALTGLLIWFLTSKLNRALHFPVAFEADCQN